MTFLCKCISTKVTEEIANPIAVFAAYFKVLKNERNWTGNYEVTGVKINPLLHIGHYSVRMAEILILK